MFSDFLTTVTAVIGDNNIGQPVADGNIHRFNVHGDRGGKNNGWYILHDNGNGLIAGSYGCWKRGITQNWCNKNSSNLTENDRQALAKAKVINQQEVEKKQLKAKEKAENIKNEATKQKHVYLSSKGFKQKGLVYKGSLIIPIYNPQEELCSLQYIDEGGEKLFLPGGAIKGNYYTIGKPNGKIYICEGYATGLTIRKATESGVVVAFNTGNLLPVTEAIRAKYPKKEIIICADNDQWTEGNPGVTKAKEAAQSVGAKLVIPAFKEILTKPTDFNDLMSLESLDEVRKQLNKRLEKNKEINDKTVERLANLSPLEYDQVREHEADVMRVRLSTLDESVKKFRDNLNKKDCESELEAGIQPWSDEVDGNKLANEINKFFLSHIILDENQSVILTLWTMATFCFEAFNIFPKLLISSPEKRCGKTTLVQLLSCLVNKSLATSNVTPAAIFRSIELWKPTLLIDEGDTFIWKNDELRGIINSGHTKSTAHILRVEGDNKNREPKRFSTWSPMAISMIKKPPDTILDRSVVISLKRKLAGQKISKLGVDAFENFRITRQKLARWGVDNLETLKKANPKLPNFDNDRAADNWLPLFSIAEVLANEWLGKTTKAFQESCAVNDDESITTELLVDIRTIFQKSHEEKIHSEDLVNKLNDLEERPWCEWKHGKPLTKNSLAKLLKPFEIKSHQMWINETNRNGYAFSDFEDAFKRYLPDSYLKQDSKTLEPSVDRGCGDFQNSRSEFDLEFKKELKSSVDEDPRVLEFQTAGERYM